jgi:hypothetical protein
LRPPRRNSIGTGLPSCLVVETGIDPDRMPDPAAHFDPFLFPFCGLLFLL